LGLSHINITEIQRMILYHGSALVVEKPDLRFSATMLDFGRAFYTTTNEKQAKTFALIVKNRAIRNGAKNPGSFVSVYDSNYDLLQKEFSILRFDSPDENWLDFVIAQRTGAYHGKKYDIIQGPVANDTIYRTITAYMNGLYTKTQTIELLKVRKLYIQIAFASREAVASLRYIGYKEAT
jgi:hypothetical protein